MRGTTQSDDRAKNKAIMDSTENKTISGVEEERKDVQARNENIWCRATLGQVLRL